MLIVPAQAILLALDRKDREREMVSVMLAALHPSTLSEDAIAQGFTSLMLACEVCANYSRVVPALGDMSLFFLCRLMLCHQAATFSSRSLYTG